jgi:hypothetical protein
MAQERRLLGALGALAAVFALAALGDVDPAASAAERVTISGRAYAFNHSETGLAGATIRVRELPALSAVADANGDYVLEAPDETNVTPYIDPPPGYHQIDLQTFHTRGKPIENANFQTPGDAEYNGLAALLAVPLGPDGRPAQCAIVTTASARNVRGVDFETFQARTPHGVAGATARGKPALPLPVYFNDNVIPDRSRTETSGDGGIIWTEVPTGVYRVITESRARTTRFASFLATCEPGRIVNANPPWGAYELVGNETGLRAGVVAGSVEKVKAVRRGGEREIAIRVTAAEQLRVATILTQHGDRVGGRRSADAGVGTTTVHRPVREAAEAGEYTLQIALADKADDSITDRVKVRLPAE